MKINKINPGYSIDPEVHELVKAYSAELTERNGFRVSLNVAVSLLIKHGYKEIRSELVNDNN